MIGSPEAWQRAAADSPLLERADALGDAPSPAEIVRLREGRDTQLVAIALELTAARRRAAPKFGARARTLIADREGVEMATSLAAAAHKARRFVTAGIHHITDLCCGIGADAMALTDANIAVHAIDADPIRAWMAATNAGCESTCADATALADVSMPIHIDPARRSGAARAWRLADYAPGPEFLARIARESPASAIKLGPGIDRDALWPCELEFISERRSLTQAVAWHGAVRGPHPRTATALPSGESISGDPADPPTGPLAGFIHTVDPALERAELLHIPCRDHSLAALHPRAGLLTADAPADSPWLRPYRVIADMPWNERRIRAWLSEHDAAIITIKPRGIDIDPDALAQRLRGHGSTDYTLFLARIDRAHLAIIAQSCEPGA